MTGLQWQVPGQRAGCDWAARGRCPQGVSTVGSISWQLGSLCGAGSWGCRRPAPGFFRAEARVCQGTAPSCATRPSWGAPGHAEGVGSWSRAGWIAGQPTSALDPSVCRPRGLNGTGSSHQLQSYRLLAGGDGF